ncbi:MAG: DnaD domain-containing protein [Candidatus Promineifilaceae bacterium]
MKGFSGFPDGKQRLIPMPSMFFSELMPHIDHLGEMKVTLYAFWALTQQDRSIRYLRFTDFIQDEILMSGLGATHTVALEQLNGGVERAVQRGTLLHVSLESSKGQTELYFMNTARGRAAVEGILTGEWRPALGRDEAAVLLVERPNIFTLYEQNIGTLTPMLAEELRDAEQQYPLQWIEQAIQRSVENNVRKWRYVRAILERWRTEGKDSEGNRRTVETQRVDQIPDELKDIIQR